MNEPQDLPPPPKATHADTLHSITRAAVAAIPYIGGFAVEVASRYFAAPLERRREAWLKELHEVLIELQSQHVDLSALLDSDDFCNLVVDATASAMRTHREEKRQALRNAITNAGRLGSAGDTKTRVFLRMIDELDVHHLLLLQLLDDPAAFLMARKMPFPPPANDGITERDSFLMDRSPRSLLSIANSTMRNSLPDELRDIVFDDLKRRGLIDAKTTFSTLCIADKTLASDLGREFIRFISKMPD